MSDHVTEERLRDALRAVRAQSIDRAMAPTWTSDDAGTGGATIHALEPGTRHAGGRRRRRLASMAAVAAALLLIVGATVVTATRRGEDRTSVTADGPDGGLGHAAAVTRVVAECRRFASARPEDPAPTADAGALATWLTRYEAALAEASDAVAGVAAADAEDRAVLDAAESNLLRAREALAAAGREAAARDELAAVREIDRARSYESIVAFELAQWGAVACDVRGVTRPTR